MHIDELLNKPGIKSITVTFSYEEIRDMSNGLYHATKTEEIFKPIFGKAKFLFDMVKYGNIQPETIKYLAEENK